MEKQPMDRLRAVSTDYLVGMSEAAIRAQEPRLKILQAFDCIDLDGSGIISSSECELICNVRRRSLAASHARSAF
jgi:Ca2+-binding EF-hand superfamily protein